MPKRPGTRPLEPAIDFVRCVGIKPGIREEHLLRQLFGRRRPDGSRRFEAAWYEMASIVGRAELASTLALYLLAGTGEHAATIAITGPSRAWQALEAMVRASESLAQAVEVIPGEHRVRVPGLGSHIEWHRGDDPDSVSVRWQGTQPLVVNLVPIGDPRVQESTIAELHYRA
jgi:hypothetical protein